MSKPKYVQFKDGRQAVVFSDAKRQLWQRSTTKPHPEYLVLLTSGLYEQPQVIKETNEVILVKKG